MVPPNVKQEAREHIARLPQAMQQQIGDVTLDYLQAAYGGNTYHRAVDGIGLPAVPTVSIAKNDQKRAFDVDALLGSITANAGPTRDRYKLYPGNNLRPSDIGGILRQADIGIMHRWQELVQQTLKRDERLASVHRGRRVRVTGRPFRVRAHQVRDKRDKPTALAMAAFVQECLDGVTGFKRAASFLMLAPCAGYAAVEPIYRYRKVHFPFDGRDIELTVLAVSELRRVYNRHWLFNDDNTDDQPLPEYDKVLQVDGQTPRLNVGHGSIFVPRHKIIFHSSYDEGLVQERGWMRTAIWMSALKQRVIALWIEFINRFGVPNVRGNVPYNLWADKARSLKYQKFLSIYGDGIATLLPDDLKITVDQYQAGGSSRDAFASFIGWIDTQNTILVQGEHLTTEIGDSGSYNAASVQANEQHAITESDDEELDETLRDQLFWSLIDLNKNELAAAMGKSPHKLLACRPDPLFRLDTRATRKERLEEFDIAITKLRLGISAQQVQDECGFDAVDEDSEQVLRLKSDE